MAQSNSDTLIGKLTAIAVAIREKTGDPDTTTYSLDDMVTKIKGLGTSGGGNTGDTPTECTHNYVNGVCTKCNASQPGYVPEPEPDPEPDIPDVPECTHSYVDGVCTQCGAEDPNYVPDVPDIPDPEPDPDDEYVTPTVNYVITAKSQPKTIVNTDDDDISSVTPIDSGNQATVSTVKGDYIWFLMIDNSRDTIEHWASDQWEDESLSETTKNYVDTVDITLSDGKKAIYYVYRTTPKGKITNQTYRII